MLKLISDQEQEVPIDDHGRSLQARFDGITSFELGKEARGEKRSPSGFSLPPPYFYLRKGEIAFSVTRREPQCRGREPPPKALASL